MNRQPVNIYFNGIPINTEMQLREVKLMVHGVDVHFTNNREEADLIIAETALHTDEFPNVNGQWFIFIRTNRRDLPSNTRVLNGEFPLRTLSNIVRDKHNEKKNNAHRSPRPTVDQFDVGIPTEEPACTE